MKNLLVTQDELDNLVKEAATSNACPVSTDEKSGILRIYILDKPVYQSYDMVELSIIFDDLGAKIKQKREELELANRKPERDEKLFTLVCALAKGGYKGLNIVSHARYLMKDIEEE